MQIVRQKRYRGHTSNKSIVYASMKDVIHGNNYRSYGCHVGMIGIHTCEDGSQGVADFQGWSVIKDGSRND